MDSCSKSSLPTTSRSPLPEELQTELSSDIPEDKHPNLLTLTRAAHLQDYRLKFLLVASIIDWYFLLCTMN